jgi:hypothetical protein
MVDIKEALYTHIPSPKELRRDVLLLTIDAIRLIKRQDYIHKLREEKQEYIKELHKIYKEVLTDVHKLQRDFPTVKLPKPKKVEKKLEPKVAEKHVSLKDNKKEAHPVVKVVQIQKKKETPVYIDPLERELLEIKSKLNRI